MALPPNSPAELPDSPIEGRDWRAVLHKLLCNAPELDQVHPGVPVAFQRAGDSIVLAQPFDLTRKPWTESFGAPAFASTASARAGMSAKEPDTSTSEALEAVVERLVDAKFLRSACLVGYGGVAVALTQSAKANNFGARVNMFQPEYESVLHAFFSEAPRRLLLTCDTHGHLALANFIERTKLFIAMPMGRVTSGELSLSWEGKRVIHAPEGSSA